MKFKRFSSHNIEISKCIEVKKILKMKVLNIFIISTVTLYLYHIKCNTTVVEWTVNSSNDSVPNCDSVRKAAEIADEERIGIIRQRRECEYAHTIIRQLHGLYSVHWNEELAYQAELWAINLASVVGQLQHSSLKFKNGTPYGENLYEITGQLIPARCHMAVHTWYRYVEEAISSPGLLHSSTFKSEKGERKPPSLM